MKKRVNYERVKELALQGKRVKEIAEELSIYYTTVSYILNLLISNYQKLNLMSMYLIILIQRRKHIGLGSFMQMVVSLIMVV